MAFVNELIPEAEKEKFTFPVFTRADGSKPTLWKWTIDRERGAYLVLTNIEGGGYEGTQESNNYVLNWNGYLIFFSGDPMVSGDVRKGQTISWRVHRLRLPQEISERCESVFELIREAFDAMGLLYRRDRVVSVSVNFDLASSS